MRIKPRSGEIGVFAGSMPPLCVRHELVRDLNRPSLRFGLVLVRRAARWSCVL
jgi:hypothetical protein